MRTGGTSGRNTNILIGGWLALPLESQPPQKANKSTAVNSKKTSQSLSHTACAAHSNVSGSFTLEYTMPMLHHQELSAALQDTCSVTPWPVHSRQSSSLALSYHDHCEKTLTKPLETCVGVSWASISVSLSSLLLGHHSVYCCGYAWGWLRRKLPAVYLHVPKIRCCDKETHGKIPSTK